MGTTNRLEISPHGFTQLGGNNVYSNYRCYDRSTGTRDNYLVYTTPSGDSIRSSMCLTKKGDQFQDRCSISNVKESGHFVVKSVFVVPVTDAEYSTNFTNIYNVVPHDRYPLLVRFTDDNWMNLKPKNFTVKLRTNNDLKTVKYPSYLNLKSVTSPFQELKGPELRTLYGVVLELNNVTTMDPTSLHCDERTASDNCQNEFGVLQVHGEWSRVIPLGWYIDRSMRRRHGADWLDQKCTNWSRSEVNDTDWLNGLEPCPCTLQQALVDIGSWVSDPDCRLPTSRCPYHPTAVHCVESALPSVDGSGNKCCYGNDSALIYTQDRCDGSAPMRYHSRSTLPYVPTLSHYAGDVMPWFYCCRYVNDRLHDVYARGRPTSSCTNYRPPKFARVFGLSHIQTLDGDLFTFGGIGEFWLLRQHDPSRLFIQARFERHTNGKTSYLSTVVFQTTPVDTIEFRVNHRLLYRRRKLVILYNNRRIWFDEPGEKWHDLKVMTIFTNSEDSSNFTVLFPYNRAVQVTSSNGIIQIILSLPAKQLALAYGLLAPYSLNRNAAVRRRSSIDRRRYNQLSKKWRVTSQDSLFFYKSFESHRQFNTVPTDYRPSFQPNTDRTSPQCKRVKFCDLDLQATDDTSLSQTTRVTYERLLESRVHALPIPTCDPIFINHTIRNSSDFRVGSVIRLDCCCNRYSSGEEIYTCSLAADGSPVWRPHIRFICKVPDNLVLIIGSIAGFVTLVIIVIIIILYIRDKRRREEMIASDYRYSEQAKNLKNSSV
ncbi:sushi domain-containing protein 2-like [Tubulanus polymorphus]|uniref:sushi domain-containing protein 2-like n=1 Tax=Tubulanus polymorphus TaxID=672921 RepID=UPI003DA6A271